MTNLLRRIWRRWPDHPVGNYTAADYRRWVAEDLAARAVRARALAVATGVLAVVVLLLTAAQALGHTATAEANCARATFHLSSFPRGLSLIAVDAEIDGQPGPALMGTWAGPSADLILNLDLSGDHVVDLYASWSAPDQRRERHLVGHVSLSCLVRPTPPPPPAVTPPAPQPEILPTAPPPAVVPMSPPPATSPAPTVEPLPRLHPRPPARVSPCPRGARWRARPSGRRVVHVRGWWYLAGCQPALGNPQPSVAVTG